MKINIYKYFVYIISFIIFFSDSPQPGGDVQPAGGRPKAGQGKRVPGARALHPDVRQKVALGREHHPDHVCHNAVFAGPAENGPFRCD